MCWNVMGVLQSLVYVFRYCTNLFICIGEINLQLYLHSCYVQVNLILVWEWSNILHGVIIPFMHINRSVQLSRFLWNTQHRCCLVGFKLNQLPPSCTLVAHDFLHKLHLHGIRAPRQMVVILLILVNEQYVVVNTMHQRQLLWYSIHDVLTWPEPLCSKFWDIFLSKCSHFLHIFCMRFHDHT
jgi:hypothetical protein